jgi:hypothetical protein
VLDEADALLSETLGIVYYLSLNVAASTIDLSRLRLKCARHSFASGFPKVHIGAVYLIQIGSS